MTCFREPSHPPDGARPIITFGLRAPRLGADGARFISQSWQRDGKGEQFDSAPRAALLARQRRRCGRGAGGQEGVLSLGQLVAMPTSKGIEKERIKDILLRGPTAENASILQAFRYN